MIVEGHNSPPLFAGGSLHALSHRGLLLFLPMIVHRAPFRWNKPGNTAALGLNWTGHELAQYRVNAHTRLNECLRPCRVDHAKNGSSKNGQIRCDGMNFDTPTSPLRVSVDVIATIIFGSLGHWTTYPSNAPSDQRWNLSSSDKEASHSAAQSSNRCCDSQSLFSLSCRCSQSAWRGCFAVLSMSHFA